MTDGSTGHPDGHRGGSDHTGDSGSPGSSPQPDDNSIVELRVPASSAFVAVLRSVAAGLAARCDLTLDEIEDLRIAVDEACALLLPLAAVGAQVSTQFRLSAGQLTIDATVPGRPGELPSRDGFGWTVLNALATDVDVRVDGERVTITLTKRRETAAK
jgi:serine/threonine-protein kinase RsbW